MFRVIPVDDRRDKKSAPACTVKGNERDWARAGRFLRDCGRSATMLTAKVEIGPILTRPGQAAAGAAALGSALGPALDPALGPLDNALRAEPLGGVVQVRGVEDAAIAKELMEKLEDEIWVEDPASAQPRSIVAQG